ncbi:MAG: hypothetical protein K2Q01_10180 [Rickettsiales bacterium]|nr:hypothetical protein [Rickettsiales bacterium]
MSQQTNPLEELKRTIVILYGITDTGGPMWIFAAVRVTRYQQFLAAQKEGTIDLEKFETFGELIVAGEGKSPPDDVILKVAEMYQTDPAQFTQNVQEEVGKQYPAE